MSVHYVCDSQKMKGTINFATLARIKMRLIVRRAHQATLRKKFEGAINTAASTNCIVISIYFLGKYFIPMITSKPHITPRTIIINIKSITSLSHRVMVMLRNLAGR